MRSIASLSALAVAGTFAVAGSASASTLAVDPGGTLRFTAAGRDQPRRPHRLGSPSRPWSPTPARPSPSEPAASRSRLTRATCPMPPNVVQNVAIDLADGNDFAHAFS